MSFLKIASYLSLGNSIFWAILYTFCCIGVRVGSITGQGGICLVSSFLIGTPVNVLCFLIFILWAIFLTQKSIIKWSQVFGKEMRLVWGFIFLLNLYVLFPLTARVLCFA